MEAENFSEVARGKDERIKAGFDALTVEEIAQGIMNTQVRFPKFCAKCGCEPAMGTPTYCTECGSTLNAETGSNRCANPKCRAYGTTQLHFV
jgi:hypothetical protein